MADKDDDFMEGEDAAGAGEAKEGGAKKPIFASAFLMQILKWVAIILGSVLFIVTVVVIVVNIMGVGQQKTDRVAESPEYETVVPVLGWYTGIVELRGVTTDSKTYVVKMLIGYDKADPNMEPAIAERRVQITDMLLTWFSKQDGSFLVSITNRDQIRETIKAEINHMLEKPVKDIRFESFQILDF